MSLRGLVEGEIFSTKQFNVLFPFEKSNQSLVANFSLKMGTSQLLVGLDNADDINEGNRKGIRLPDNFTPHHISILVKPKNFNIEERAVLMLVGDRRSVTYQTLIRLQVSCAVEHHEKVDKIIAHLASEGTLSPISHNCSQVFLANCTFKFNLYDQQGK